MKSPRSTTTETVADGKVKNLTPSDEQLPGMTPADPDPSPARKRTDSRRRHDQPTGNPPGRPSTSAAPRPAGKPSNHAKLAKALADQHVFAGAMLTMFSPLTGRAMIEQSEQCGESLATWADSNPKVAAALNRMVNGAGAVGVLAAYAPIAMALYQDLAARDAGKLSTPRRTAPPSSSPSSANWDNAARQSMDDLIPGGLGAELADLSDPGIEIPVDPLLAEVLYEPGFMAPNS